MQPNTNTNFIARIARWSAEHRKTAIFGWIAFVVVLFGVVMNAQVIETQRLTTAESIAGEAGDAEELLTDAGLRPTSEVAFVQNKSATVNDPEFEAVIDDVAATLSSTKKVENVTSPVDGTGGGYSEDGHSAFVEFEIIGDPRRTSPLTSSPAWPPSSDLQEEYPELQRRAVRRRIRREGHQRHHPVRRRQGRDAVPADHADRPARRTRCAGRGQRPARPRHHLGAGDDGGRCDPQPGLPARREHRRADPVDRARRRGRLRAVLHAP